MVGMALTLSAERFPDRTAVAFYEVRRSYAELNSRACRLAHALSESGVTKGDRVATLLHNCPEFVEALFAVAKLGVVLVPINFRLTGPEIGRIIEGCTPKALIYGGEFAETLVPLARSAASFPMHLVCCRDPASPAGTLISREYESWIGGYPDAEPAVAVSMTDDLLIIHTSGTTGHPKGAVLTHGNTLFSSMTKIIDFGLRPTDTIVVFGPLFHVGPLMDLALPAWQRGGTVVLGRSRGFEPGHLLSVLEREKATVVSIYPVMWRRVLDLPDLARYDLSRLRLLLTGSEPMPPSLLRGIYERFAGVAFVNTYGSTEGGPVTTFLGPEDRFQKMGSIGKPAFGVRVKIVDERGNEVGPGVVGELAVRSPFVCRGYWNRPDETAAALRGGWWHTGDLAMADPDGFLWIGGRKKDMIISGAENIYPVEIEQVIATLEGVAEVAVVGVPDAEWGEAVAAFVVRKPGSALDDAGILAHCRAQLAGYKKPRHIVFVDELPRTSITKVSKEQLRQRFRQG
jgi:fatty-acyl-CoA synthase